jgi:hypothetical protein
MTAYEMLDAVREARPPPGAQGQAVGVRQGQPRAAADPQIGPSGGHETAHGLDPGRTQGLEFLAGESARDDKEPGRGLSEEHPVASLPRTSENGSPKAARARCSKSPQMWNGPTKGQWAGRESWTCGEATRATGARQGEDAFREPRPADAGALLRRRPFPLASLSDRRYS